MFNKFEQYWEINKKNQKFKKNSKKFKEKSKKRSKIWNFLKTWEKSGENCEKIEKNRGKL